MKTQSEKNKHFRSLITVVSAALLSVALPTSAHAQELYIPTPDPSTLTIPESEVDQGQVEFPAEGQVDFPSGGQVDFVPQFEKQATGETNELPLDTYAPYLLQSSEAVSPDLEIESVPQGTATEPDVTGDEWISQRSNSSNLEMTTER